MEIEFDAAKNERNFRVHGLRLEDFNGFDNPPSVYRDNRIDYGETRYIAIGRIDGKGHVVVYTLRGDRVRLISWRRAHEKEMKRHER